MNKTYDTIEELLLDYTSDLLEMIEQKDKIDSYKIAKKYIDNCKFKRCNCNNNEN